MSRNIGLRLRSNFIEHFSWRTIFVKELFLNVINNEFLDFWIDFTGDVAFFWVQTLSYSLLLPRWIIYIDIDITMINKNSLLWFILIFVWLYSWLCSSSSNLWWFCTRYSFVWSHFSIAHDSSRFLMLLKLLLILSLLLDYCGRTYVLLQMLLIFLVLVNAWSQILLSCCSWRSNWLALNLNVWSSSATSVMIYSDSRSLSFCDSWFVLN